MTGDLADLAAWLESQLDDETASRQVIAERALAWLRILAAPRPADTRVTAATEFLAAVRRRKVTEVPYTVLAREGAELRRRLGQVLDHVAETGAAAAAAPAGTALSPADLETVRAALGHAEDWLRDRASWWCDDCVRHAFGACPGHGDDLGQAGVYAELAARLGGAR